MSAKPIECFLECVAGIHPPFRLMDKVPFILGRSKESKVKDSRCSKKQVEFIPDFSALRVTVKQIGINASAVNGKRLGVCGTASLEHGDVAEVLEGQYFYKLQFFPPPVAVQNNEKCDNEAKKIKLDNEPDTLWPSSKEPALSWETFFGGKLYVFGRKGIHPSRKIAAYDMDGTLITTRSGNVFPKGYDDWRINYPSVPGKLKELMKDGYKIVIFTNQKGVAIGKQKISEVQQKIERVASKLGVQCQVFISTGEGKFRKPLPGMWEFLLSECNNGRSIDLKESFYVGDAAGRPEIPRTRRKDHSCSDRLFAFNVGVQFMTPEEHFLGRKPEPYVEPEFSPKRLITEHLFEPATSKVPAYPQEICLFVGYPGSGKSFVAENSFKKWNYVIANRDTLGSWQKCVHVMEKSIKEGRSVVIDNTNPDTESRRRYIEVAQKLGIPIRCFLFNVSRQHAQHNNKFRELVGSDHVKVNEMIFNSYRSKYKEPCLSEGFADMVKVNFIPKFQSSEEKQLYEMYLLEK